MIRKVEEIKTRTLPTVRGESRGRGKQRRKEREVRGRGGVGKEHHYGVSERLTGAAAREEGVMEGGACLSTGLGGPREVPHSFPQPGPGRRTVTGLEPQGKAIIP
jgi:hypothetical protein